ncbi:MAG: hypothetical protein OES15_01435 [Nitrosopumilus sp.]|nr:hypothetical protein [Nitrosopumilus sp.]
MLVLKKSKKMRIKKNVMLVIAIGLLAFGIFNFSNTIYAQNNNNFTSPIELNNGAPFQERLIILVVEQLITIVAPITGSVVLMFTQFLNKKGIKISQETQDYFAKTASDYVKNEARYMFKQFMDVNSPYYAELREGRISPKLREKVYNRTKDNLERELKSDSFSRAAKKMLKSNLETVIESAVSKNHQDTANRTKDLLTELVPIAIESALLYNENKVLNDEQKEKIIDTAMESLKKNFDQEYVIMSIENTKMYLQAELRKRISQTDFLSDG